MHELSITEEMLKLVLEQAEKADISRVNKINLVIGELTGYAGDSIQFYFDVISKDSIAEHAQLSFTLMPGKLKCRDCGKTFILKNFDFVCPSCQSNSVQLIGGRDLFVESIEGD